MELDVNDYGRGIKELQHSIVIRLMMQMGGNCAYKYDLEKSRGRLGLQSFQVDSSEGRNFSCLAKFTAGTMLRNVERIG